MLIFVYGLVVHAQNNSKYDHIKRIELQEFSNAIAMQMATDVIALAKQRNQHIAIEIKRLNYTVFLYVDDNLPSDKIDWLRRKANLVKRFEDSSLSIKNDFIKEHLKLYETFGLKDEDYVLKGGAIPIFVKGAGMVAIITVSGLHDVEDHNIIIEALQGKYF